MGRPIASTIEVATPRRVLDAAEVAFGAFGYAGARLADIARVAGIRRSSLLYHFRSKESLYAAVVQRVFDDLGAALVEVMDSDEDFLERVHGLVDTFVDFLDARPSLAPVLMRQMLDGQGPGRNILMKRVVPLLDVIERFLRVEGRGYVRPDLPLRSALMHVVANVIMRAASGDLRGPLWGEDDAPWPLTRALLFEEGPERTQ